MGKYDYAIIGEIWNGGINVGYVFEYNGQEYIGDITTRTDLDYINEFAVFKSVDRQITFDNAIPLFRKLDVSKDYASCKEYIQEFINTIKNK